MIAGWFGLERDRHPGASVTNEGPRPRVVEGSGKAFSREACPAVIVTNQRPWIFNHLLYRLS